MGIMILLISFSFARESLYRAPARAEVPAVQSAKAVNPVPALRASASSAAAGNLNGEIIGAGRNFRMDDATEITPKEIPKLKLKGLKPGDVIDAEINEEVTAYPDSKVPVRAVVALGKFKGSVLLGEATLEKNSKRVAITFKEIVGPRESDPYPVSGYSLVEGEHHTNEDKFFLGEFLSAAAAGFADSTVNRSQNVLGNYVEEPGLDTSGKKALATALSKTSDHFAEKSRATPEYTVIPPFTHVQILVQ